MNATYTPAPFPFPFPVHSLPPLLRDAVIEVQKNSQAPSALVVASALSAISLACQGAVNVLRPGDLLSPTSLYLLTIAESGERKTSVDAYFTKPIRDFEAVQAGK
ncbi:MAG: DUF3987 domain-containing protein, partial [Halothiobacillus sp.]|nr:DUF3987 domain-containing protein [Halothiobacillus sp.]